MKVKLINWGEKSSPNKECSYNHVRGETPLGDFLITWKGWKESPSYDIEHLIYGGYLYSLGSLEEAKEEAQLRYAETVNNCIETK